MDNNSYNFLEFRLNLIHNDQMFIFVLKDSEIGFKSNHNYILIIKIICMFIRRYRHKQYYFPHSFC